MKKKLFENINLTCVLQDSNSTFANLGTHGTSEAFESAGNLEPSVTSPKVVPGMLSTTDDGVLFQETIPHKREVRNNRLYEGTLTNLVLRKDGLYHPFVKGYKAGGPLTKQDYAFRVYFEITKALEPID